MPEVTIASPDGPFSAYLAIPENGKGPGILVIQEIFGVNQDMRDHCDAMAAEGYFALCPDLYWRQEVGVQLTDKSKAEWEKAGQLYYAFDAHKAVEDLQIALTHLRAVQGCNGKVGSMGFCLGGLMAYLMASRTDSDCNVGYYGVGIEKKLGEAGNIRAPTLLHIAEQDQFVPNEIQNQIKLGLDNNSNVTIHSYPHMDHAFARHDGTHYDAANTKLARKRTMDAFETALKD